MPAEIKINGTSIEREIGAPLFHFTDYFKGFETLPCIRELFGEKTEEVLHNLKVEFNSFRWGYMGVSNDGYMFISTYYLGHGEETGIYLDLVHELVHVRQHLEGKELFDDAFEYVDRPTEVEAYTLAVREARRLGLSDEKIFDYLKTEWMSAEEHLRLAKSLGVKPTPTTSIET